MPRFTDLPKWNSLSKDEKEAAKDAVAIKSYTNYDGIGSVSKKELDHANAYQEEIKNG